MNALMDFVEIKHTDTTYKEAVGFQIEHAMSTNMATRQTSLKTVSRLLLLNELYFDGFY